MCHFCHYFANYVINFLSPYLNLPRDLSAFAYLHMKKQKNRLYLTIADLTETLLINKHHMLVYYYHWKNEILRTSKRHELKYNIFHM